MDYKIRMDCPKCGMGNVGMGNAVDAVAALDAVRDGARRCATCGGALQGAEAWEDAWDGKYVAGFHGPHGWEEDGDSDRVRTEASEYVYVWRLQNEIMDAEPFHYEEYGDGTEIEVSYATEAEARAALEDVRDGLEDADELVLEHVRPTRLEVRQ